MSNVQTQCIYNYSKLRCYSMSNSETYKYVAWPVCSHVYLKFFRCKSLSLVFTWLKLPRKALLPAINQPKREHVSSKGYWSSNLGTNVQKLTCEKCHIPIPRIFFLRKVADFSKICKFALRIHWCSDVKSRSREGANNEVSALQHRALQIRSPSFFLSCSQIKARRIGLQLSVRFSDRGWQPTKS